MTQTAIDHVDTTSLDLVNDTCPAGLFAKLAAVTAEIGSVEARGINTFLGARYVTEEDVLNAVRAKLTDRNVALLPSLVAITERAAKTAKGKDTTITTVRVAYTFCDGDTGLTWRSEWAGTGEDQGDKGLVKAGTQALRTFLLKTFLVAAADPAQPQAPARQDGQTRITPDSDLYAAVIDAFEKTGNNLKLLNDTLDAFDIPRKHADADLTPSQRVQMLTAPAAIAVAKKLNDTISHGRQA